MKENPQVPVEKFRDIFDMAQNCAQTEAKIIEDLLDTSQMCVGKLSIITEPVDLKASILRVSYIY